jgi:succinyl-diaminopimelate desuccinylase
MSDLEYEVDLLSRLVSLDTNSNEKRNYKECSQLLLNEAKKLGLSAEIFDGKAVLKGDDRPRPNVVIDLNKNSNTTLILLTHYDIVPPGEGWTRDPFKLTVENGKAYGRGASDDKGGVVTCFGALAKLKDDELANTNVKLIVTCDEEVGGEGGIEYLTDVVKIRGDAALVVDSGPEYVSCGASGVIWGKILVRGRQGHAGYPHKAVNAIDEAIKIVSSLQQYKKKLTTEKISKLPAPPDSPKKNVWRRLSVTMIHAGDKENIIPGECDVRFDLRTLPDEDIEKVRVSTESFIKHEARKKGVDIDYQVIHVMPGYFTNPTHPLITSLNEATKKIGAEQLPVAADLGGNDGTYLAKVKIPVACFGPLREGTNYHGVDEFVHLKDLSLVRDVLVNLCRGGREKLSR